VTRANLNLGIIFGLTIAAAIVLPSGCASQSKPSATTQPTTASARGGAQLWSDNCARCHNLHSPSHYSPMQWDVTVHAMRVRYGLSGHAAKAISEFLQSASR